MTKLPKEIRKRLRSESTAWAEAIHSETLAETQALLDQAEPFEVQRPPRKPVSVRLDAFDLALIKRIARQKGIPHSQLMALWLHERLQQEKIAAGG